MEIRVLVVVPVLNLWNRYTKPMLDSIQCKYPWAAYLIDNGSTDETKDLEETVDLRAEQNKILFVKHNAVNKGCAGGWNQGLEYARENGFTHVLIANNDIIMSPNTVDALVERLEKGDKTLVSSVDVSGEIQNAEDITHGDHMVNHKEESEAPHPNFSCFMVKADFVDEIGWVDEGFFPAYFEDNDIHRRIKLAKGDEAAIAVTTSVFYHFGSRTQNESDSMPVVNGNLFEQNRQYFINKWGGEPGHETFATPFNDPNNDWKYATRK